MRFIVILLTGSLPMAAALQAQVFRTLDDGLLSSLRTEAARSHPMVAAGKNRELAAAHDARGVRLWEDPMVDIGFMGAVEMMRQDDGDVMIGIGQTLPKPGMYEAELLKMEAMRRAASENTGGATLEAGALAGKAAIELALMDESIILRTSQIEWMAAMVENAKQMAADPMGNSTEALRMETELAKERQMLEAERRSREGYTKMLNIALGRKVDTQWPALRLPADPPPVPVVKAEIARIPFANPKVRAMKQMVTAARADTRVADRERLPEVAVGVDTKLYSGTGDIRSTTVGIKLSMPWFNDASYQARIRAAKNRELAAEGDVEAMRREIAGMVSMYATEAANAAAQARAYSGEILDKATNAVRTTEAAWISSKVPLTDLLDSSRVLYSIRLEQRRMIAMQLAAIEQLHTLVPNR